MRWIWRILVLLLLINLIKVVWAQPQPKTFIAWPEKSNFVEKIKGDWFRWQQEVQDLPASIEVQLHRLWQDFQPNGSGSSV